MNIPWLLQGKIFMVLWFSTSSSIKLVMHSRTLMTCSLTIIGAPSSPSSHVLYCICSCTLASVRKYHISLPHTCSTQRSRYTIPPKQYFLAQLTFFQKSQPLSQSLSSTQLPVHPRHTFILTPLCLL